jgi:hypothetical protein
MQKQQSNAAAALVPQKFFDRRESGIVTYFQSDVTKAESLEKTYAAELIAAGVASVKSANRKPVPGLVDEAIGQLMEAAEREEKEQARKRQAEETPPAPPPAKALEAMARMKRAGAAA